MDAFLAILLLASLITLCWLSYLIFCFRLALKVHDWADGAAKIATAFWRNVGRGFRSATFDPRIARKIGSERDPDDEPDSNPTGDEDEGVFD
ncbi:MULTISPECIES: hypothetical protein [Streptomyces]|uniref:hypothetical protein n=1 Tax=Streptomyces TaxID=1883 RepID=UPI0029B3ABF3|nr:MULTISPECIES: hypothetical protein [Streptomyces]MDX3122739.1 hypothetical protein [Streptomyces scabiei]MDX3199338.1 hypothetical protein [Streptomyces scabiei]MDX3223088.1 hypothetical protein [Streptomyces scabiei]MDX3672701.1 hypothetical protein [Streptomyces europaeiscabiei]